MDESVKADAIRWVGNSKAIFQKRATAMAVTGAEDGDPDRGTRFAETTIKKINEIADNLNIAPEADNGTRILTYTIPKTMKRLIVYKAEKGSIAGNPNANILSIIDAGKYSA